MDMIEEYEERKRLRRSRFRWRVVAVLALLGVAALLFAQREPETGPHIARYAVEGVIDDDRQREEILAKIEEDETVEALIVTINSPGGTVVGSEILYDNLRKIAEKKPVVAVMRNVAASGGYMAAIGADHIVARGNTITGSVGVIAHMPNAHKLLNNIGLEVLEVKSGPLKAQPSPFQPVDPATVTAKEAMVAESFAWFLDLVQQRRDLSPNAAREIEAGGIFTGRQALDLALIDALGGEDAAIKWLESEREIPPEREVIDYVVAEKGMLESFADLFGLGRSGRAFLSPGLFAIYR